MSTKIQIPPIDFDTSTGDEMCPTYRWRNVNKNTRQWCRGVPGRWHMPVRLPFRYTTRSEPWPGYKEVCDVCGKTLRNVVFWLGSWHRWS